MESPHLGSAIYTTRPDGEPRETVHDWFALSYSSYLVLHRSLLQSMPTDWQHRFVSCLRELDDTFAHLEQAPSYEVRPVRWCAPTDLTPAQLAAAGVTVEREHDNVEHGALTYYLHGIELDPYAEEVPLTVREPVPGYDRGRTRMPTHPERPQRTDPPGSRRDTQTGRDPRDITSTQRDPSRFPQVQDDRS